MRTRKLTTAALVMALLFTVSPADADDGWRETPFVSLGVGARSLGMGGGFSSLAADATAIHYNAAGLASLEYQEFAFMHSVLMEGSIYDFASWAYPINENHGFGAGVMRIGTGDIIRRTDFADRGLFNYAYTQVVLAYGRNLSEPISVGFASQIFQQSLDGHSDFGMGLDLGLKARLWKDLDLSLVAHEIVQNDLVLVERPEKTDMVLIGGLGLQRLVLSDDVSMALAFEVEKMEGRDTKIRTGGEITLYDALSLRSGYDRENMSFGVGVKSGRIRADYAYKLVDYTDGIHHISLSFMLGLSTP